MDVDLSFREWLLALEMGAAPAAAVKDATTQAKQSILQQASQPGTDTKQVAKDTLNQAAQQVAADPQAGVDKAVEIGVALDKVNQAGGKRMMKKRMKKRMRKK